MEPVIVKRRKGSVLWALFGAAACIGVVSFAAHNSGDSPADYLPLHILLAAIAFKNVIMPRSTMMVIDDHGVAARFVGGGFEGAGNFIPWRDINGAKITTHNFYAETTAGRALVTEKRHILVLNVSNGGGKYRRAMMRALLFQLRKLFAFGREWGDFMIDFTRASIAQTPGEFKAHKTEWVIGNFALTQGDPEQYQTRQTILDLINQKASAN